MRAPHIVYEKLPACWQQKIKHIAGALNPRDRWTYIADGSRFKNGVSCVRHIMKAEGISYPRGFGWLKQRKTKHSKAVKPAKAKTKKNSWGKQLEAVMVEVTAAKRQLDHVNSMLVDLRNQVKY